MTIQSQYNASSNTLTIMIRGRLDFKVRQEFREAYENTPTKPGSVIIDLQETEFMDSSGLGMLLLLRDYLRADQSMIRLRNAGDKLSKVLAVANFDKLFTVE